MGTLKLCDTETPSDRQILYAFRTGLLYHRLANLYDASYWRTIAGSGSAPSEDDLDNDGEARRKKLLQLSRLYYEKSVKQHEQLGEPKEYLQVQCDRLTLQNRLAEGNFISKDRFQLIFLLCIIYKLMQQSYSSFVLRNLLILQTHDLRTSISSPISNLYTFETRP